MTATIFRFASTLLFASLFALAPARAEPGDPPVGFRADPDAPIEIEADSLEVEQTAEKATFVGNVVAVQGPMQLNSDRLVVHYAQKSGDTADDSGEPGSGTEITHIRATGNVHVTSEDDQSADGDWALYQVSNAEITMGDAVVLRQGENVIRGQRLTIDLNSGQARVDGGVSATDGENGGSGRVRGLFQAPQQ
ncbi:MAG: lipopolysaccharide transport periplasmic protein LptA [Parvibaculaceae bacterium]